MLITVYSISDVTVSLFVYDNMYILCASVSTYPKVALRK